jgi:hypothetical protein
MRRKYFQAQFFYEVNKEKTYACHKLGQRKFTIPFVACLVLSIIAAKTQRNLTLHQKSINLLDVRKDIQKACGQKDTAGKT